MSLMNGTPLLQMSHSKPLTKKIKMNQKTMNKKKDESNKVKEKAKKDETITKETIFQLIDPEIIDQTHTQYGDY